MFTRSGTGGVKLVILKTLCNKHWGLTSSTMRSLTTRQLCTVEPAEEVHNCTLVPFCVSKESLRWCYPVWKRWFSKFRYVILNIYLPLLFFIFMFICIVNSTVFGSFVRRSPLFYCEFHWSVKVVHFCKKFVELSVTHLFWAMH